MVALRATKGEKAEKETLEEKCCIGGFPSKVTLESKVKIWEEAIRICEEMECMKTSMKECLGEIILEKNIVYSEQVIMSRRSARSFDVANMEHLSFEQFANMREWILHARQWKFVKPFYLVHKIEGLKKGLYDQNGLCLIEKPMENFGAHITGKYWNIYFLNFNEIRFQDKS